MKKLFASVIKLAFKLYDVIKYTPIWSLVRPFLNIAAFFIWSIANSRQYWNNQGVVILYYHKPFPSQFEKHLKFIPEHWNIISLDALCESIKSGKNNKNSVVITLDDGDKSNFHFLQIIKKYSVPVMIYLTSDIIGTDKEFWWDTLRNLKAAAGACRNKDVLIRSPEYYKSIPEKQKIQEISGAITKLGYYPRERCALSFQEIEEMLHTGMVTFGSHSKTHPCLSMTSDESAWEEIVMSKEYLEAKLGTPIKHFSYPDGCYQEKHIKMVKKAGYTSAATTIPLINTSNTSLFELRRIAINQKDNVSLLAIRISGLWNKLGFDDFTIEKLRTRGLCF